MAKFLASQALKSLVDKATRDDQSPTPGFLYNEINKQSFTSVENCQKLQDLLLKRLNTDSPDVKLKSLRVIKQLLMKGHRSFRTELQRRTNELQFCLEYRGSPDPLRGEVPFQRVRDEAKEIMKLVFVSDVSSSYETPKTSNEAVKSISSSQSYNSSPSLVGRITGTGNYIPPPESTGNSIFEAIKSSSAKLASVVRGEPEEEFNPSKHWSSDFKLSNFNPPPSQLDYSHGNSYEIGERISQPGKPGGSWSHDPIAHPLESLNESKVHETQILPTTRPSVKQEMISSNFDQTTPESVLVDKITAPGGIRSVLSRMEVGQFIRQSKGMNVDLLSLLLYQKLRSDSPWQSKLRSLCLIEGIITYFGDSIEHRGDKIAALLDSPQKTIRERVQKILSLLHYEQVTNEIEETPVVVDKLFLLDEQENKVAQSQLQPLDQFTSPKSPSSMFSGLIITPHTSTPSPQQENQQNNQNYCHAPHKVPTTLQNNEEDPFNLGFYQEQAVSQGESTEIKIEEQTNTNSQTTPSGFDFINESDSFSFIADRLSAEGQRAQEAASKHRQQILDNYKRN